MNAVDHIKSSYKAINITISVLLKSLEKDATDLFFYSWSSDTLTFSVLTSPVISFVSVTGFFFTTTSSFT